MKTIAKCYACITAAVALASMTLFTGCSASAYSEEQHIQRITARAEKRFLREGSEYTGLEVYPIYNEYDELKYALIEFQPKGFVYVHIGEQEYPWKGMYTLSDTKSESWMPYRVKEGAQENVTDENGNIIAHTFNREHIRDENGLVPVYYESHFKVAGIENERRYFLSTVTAVYVGQTNGFIPAVKRGEKYLDLVDGETIEYTPGMKSAYAIANEVGFINNSNFDL